jgi:hypothetical protein
MTPSFNTISLPTSQSEQLQEETQYECKQQPNSISVNLKKVSV